MNGGAERQRPRLRERAGRMRKSIIFILSGESAREKQRKRFETALNSISTLAETGTRQDLERLRHMYTPTVRETDGPMSVSGAGDYISYDSYRVHEFLIASRDSRH